MDFSKLKTQLKDFYLGILDEKAKKFYEHCTEELDKLYDERLSSYELKEIQYKLIAEEFEPVIFSESPFYYEMGAMAGICDGAYNFRGHKHPGGWTNEKRKHLYWETDRPLYDKFINQRSELLYLVCGNFCDELQHFPFNYTPIFKIGLKGLYERADNQLKDAKGEEILFLNALKTGLLAIKKISEKFSIKAKELLKLATDKKEIENLTLIMESASYSPWNAPKNFYQALNTYALLRKAIGVLEGIGTNSFGRVDLDLYPFYKKDVESGVLTKEKAKELISIFLITWDNHYDHDMKMVGYSDHELENTYTLGGYDIDGNHVYNEVTSLFLQAFTEHKIIYPKLKARYAFNSPKEYLDEINVNTVNGTSTVLYCNDDAIIPALLKSGKTRDEAYNYLVSGCWDLNCLGVEKHDGGSYFNLLKAFEFFIHKRFDKMQKVNIDFKLIDDAKSFEEVYDICLSNFLLLAKERHDIISKGRVVRKLINPLPIYSSTMANCIENRRDYTNLGAKYNDDCIYLVGLPNVVDSLLAIKELCFERKKYTLVQFLDAVRNNWAGYENIRQDALKCSFWGDELAKSTELAKRLNDDIYDYVNNPNFANGKKTAVGHLTYTEIKWWGEQTLATPDGRKNGEYFSQGLTPSRLHKISSVTSLLNSLRGLNIEKINSNSVVNIILPSNKITLNDCESFIRACAVSNVQSLQLNCVTKEQLLDAQIHPENHRDLIVRVTGFSALFTSLSPAWQDEFLTRNFYD